MLNKNSKWVFSYLTEQLCPVLGNIEWQQIANLKLASENQEAEAFFGGGVVLLCFYIFEIEVSLFCPGCPQPIPCQVTRTTSVYWRPAEAIPSVHWNNGSQPVGTL
jgi:hypothetical protein